jgi:putative pyruvate formate lyase activating enzyme
MSGRALANYYGILDGDRQAKYLGTKQRMVEVDFGLGEAALWKAHDEESTRPHKSADGPNERSLLDLKAELARRMLSDCRLCERRCRAVRAAGKKGHCGVLDARISSEFIHMGEEPDLVPSYTIFFSGCTFNCVFCQNWDISTRPGTGQAIEPAALARKIEIKAGIGTRGVAFSLARNVNWVGGDPTSNLPFILDVLTRCHANIPQVWNSNMYLSEETMRLLNDVVDVYLTDFKYGNDKCALRLSNAPNYMHIMRRNHLAGREHAEMIIRHLVLPGHLDCCTRPVLTWIGEQLKDVKVNVMAQYRPEHRAKEFPEIARALGVAEYREALEIAESIGLDLSD